MKVSGKKVADAISKKLQKEIENLKVKPTLVIILAGENPSSRIYVNFKIKRAKEIGVNIKYFEFSKNQFNECLNTIQKLNTDKKIDGIIVQYPVYESWNFDEMVNSIDPRKDVDGFREDSLHHGATAMGVWEMLTAFGLLEGFSKTEKFLENKKVVLLGRGKTAGGPIRKLLESHGIKISVVHSKTENPDKEMKSADVVISATGKKHIVNKDNLKKGTYVIGVGVGKEIVEGEERIYGDIHEQEIAKIAKLYCPTIGGIGPLTIVCLLKNVVESAKEVKS
ncbi:bifunctional 5,10-methylenetetrahydrofolate dehydrogenase/5,10-methenyltetrahydrofolate cyclohydrolase [Patescibacteria group bacterium]|nr:bifunctional 5,10-methylenetetrahydrofolate dehydrogenase/5,10-methenyltetrahydrofolate cyclohydrolase [Patescibacteria group bacterium]